MEGAQEQQRKEQDAQSFAESKSQMRFILSEEQRECGDRRNQGKRAVPGLPMSCILWLH